MVTPWGRGAAGWGRGGVVCACAQWGRGAGGWEEGPCVRMGVRVYPHVCAPRCPRPQLSASFDTGVCPTPPTSPTPPASPTEVYRGGAVSRRTVTAAPTAPAALPGAASGAGPAVPGPAQGRGCAAGRPPRPRRRRWGLGLTLCPPGADPQQGEERAELRTAGAGLRGGVSPAAARREPAARVPHGELPRHPGGPGRAHPPGPGGGRREAGRGQRPGQDRPRGGWAPGCGLTARFCSRRATSSCGRGLRARGCPGRATTAMSSCSATTWWSASPRGIPAPTPSAMSSGT